MSEIKTDKLSPRTGAGTVTLGTSGDSYTIPAGVTLTNAGTLTIPSGGTLTVASGGTITNSGTATGFGDDNTPAFLARLSADQSIANATWVKLLINTEMFDSDGTYDNSTNYRFTVPSGQAGTYVFWYGTQFNEVTSGRYSSVVLYVNGTFESSHPSRSRTAYGYTIKNIQGHDNHNGTSMMKLIVGDYVEVWVAHNHGSAKNAGGDETYFGGFKVAGA
jgi:hypothetical protein